MRPCKTQRAAPLRVLAGYSAYKENESLIHQRSGAALKVIRSPDAVLCVSVSLMETVMMSFRYRGPFTRSIDT